MLVGLLTAMLIFTVAGFLGVPFLLRHTVVHDVAVRLERRVEVAKVSFNPFTLSLEVDGLRIGETSGSRDFLEIGRLIANASWNSLFRMAPIITRLIVSQPHLYLVRNSKGQLNFSNLIEAKQHVRASPPFRFAVSNIQIRGGEILFDDWEYDERHTIRQLTLNIPFIANFPADVNIDVTPRLQMLLDGRPVRIVGRVLPFARPSESIIDLNLDRLDLARFASYLPRTLPIKITQGTLSAALMIHFVMPPVGEAIRCSGRAVLNGITLWDSRNSPLLRLESGSLVLGDVQPFKRIADLKSVLIRGLAVFGRLNSNGTTNFSRIALALQPNTQELKTSAPPPTSWKYQIGSVVFENATANIDDHYRLPQPLELVVGPIDARLGNVSSTLGCPFSLEANSAINSTGRLRLVGTAAIKPFLAKLRIAAQQLDLTEAAPYISAYSNVELADAKLNMNGELTAASSRDALNLQYAGDASLGPVRLLDKISSTRFLEWKDLTARRIDAKFGRGQPTVRIGDLSLSDFYSRLILNSRGGLNLREIIKRPQASTASLTQEQSTLPSAHFGTREKPLNADIEVGEITLRGGTLDYTDDFIRPHYTASVKDIAGRIGSFGTGSTAPAKILLAAQLNGNAPMGIYGKINPLIPLAFLDLRANANQVQLSPFTPFSTAYTGYPITKGTITVNVHYLLSDGNLTANNVIYINRLTLGPHVEYATARNLPVRLAVDLLENQRGEINLDLPVSGSLSNPHFNLGAALINAAERLIIRAATSPFRFIASIFGGAGQQLQRVNFAPGSAALTPESLKRLSTLAAAVKSRPGLDLKIQGTADPTVDRGGLKDAWLQQVVQQQKAKSLAREGVTINPITVRVAPEQFDKYLSQVYNTAKIAKPRDFVGLTKSLPPNREEQILLANVNVTARDLAQLANSRAAVVRQWLSKWVSVSRLSLATPKLNADHAQVDFSLSAG
jgi:Domain of Unknown Function (DUF748)